MVNTIVYRWFIGFYKVLESFASRTFTSLKDHYSLNISWCLAKVSVFTVLDKEDAFWGEAVDWGLGGTYLDWFGWGDLTVLNKYQFALYFLATTILMVTKNSDSWCCSEGLPVILNLLLSDFSHFPANVADLHSTLLTSLPFKHLSEFLLKGFTFPDMPAAPSLITSEFL